jgi:hypothetical protein
MQLLSLSLLCIKFKYFKIILLKYLNVKIVAEIIKIISNYLDDVHLVGHLAGVRVFSLLGYVWLWHPSVLLP